MGPDRNIRSFPTSERVVWVGVGLLALTLAGALGAGALVLRDTSGHLLRGEAERMMGRVREAWQREGDAALEAAVAREREGGLRCAAVLGPPGRGVAAGECGEVVSRAARSERFERVGGRVRLTVLLPPPGEGRGHGALEGRPPPGHPPPPGLGRPFDHGPPFPPPCPWGDCADLPPPGAPPPLRLLLIELEPVVTVRAERGVRAVLGAGAVVLAAAVGVGVGLVRLLRGRERLLLELERGRQLRQLGELSAVMAHEIRNPLTALKGHIQLLQEQLPEASKARLKADRVEAEARRLEALVRDLLAFAGGGHEEPSEVSPGALIERARERCGAPERVEVLTGQAPGRVRLRSESVGRALLNLLGNALQASPPDERVEVEARREGRGWQLWVRDRGPGVPAGEEERVFEPFHTTRLQGTGLGLAVVQRTAQEHGGRAWVRGRAGGGAEFCMEFPEV